MKDIIHSLNNYSFNNRLITNNNNNNTKQKVFSFKKEKNNDVKNDAQYDQPTKNNNDNFYEIKQTDSMFWIIYITLYGYDKYEFNLNNIFQIEKQIKMEFHDEIKKNKSILKANKIRLNDVLENLIYDKTLTLVTIKALCLVYNIDFFTHGVVNIQR